MDLRAADNALVLPGESRLILVNVRCEIPQGYELQVRPRSSLSRRGIIAAFGTIDSDYRGEIGVVLTNASREQFSVCIGDRIAQLVCAKVERVEWQQVETLSDSTRGVGGFGSTGK
jgi:dUTP pyrophosphatase